MAIRPSPELKGYRTGAEVGYVDLRRWFFCHTRMSRGSTFQQFDHALGISASSHVDGDFDRALAIREGPVSHLTRDERSIWHNDFRTIRGANNAGPDADAANLSHIAPYLDDVTDFNRTFKKQNQAGHKIIDHVLQSKPDPDAECSGQDCHLCQVNPERSQGDEEAYEQDDIVKHRRDRVRNPGGEMQMMIDVFFQHKTQEFRDQKRSPNRDQECQDAAQRNIEGAECEVRVQGRSNRRD